MANHKSSKKRILQTATKTERNRFYKTRLKNVVRAVNEAVEAKNVDGAKEAFKVANKFLHKCVSKNILKKNTAARKVSRLNTIVNTLG